MADRASDTLCRPMPDRPVLELLLGDVVRLRRPHPCGGTDWRVDRLGADIGPVTIARYRASIADAKTVLWNGPMGVFEIAEFATGTDAIARAVAAVRGTTIVGGGDSIAAIRKAGVSAQISHISTGGGASLEFLGGRTLPGVAALTDK